MGRGLSNTELARELTLSEATVKTHVARTGLVAAGECVDRDSNSR
jgi:DNA-directed RNA polymerase specialized sigma24 family protein